MEWDKSEIFNIVSDILKDCEGIFCYTGYSSTKVSIRDMIFSDKNCTKNIIKNDDCDVVHGIQRVVLIPKNKPYVIKIPITGYCEPNDIGFYIYQVVNFNDYNPFEDENERVNELISSARELFLENIFIGYYRNIPIYIQEKVIPYDEGEFDFIKINNNLITEVLSNVSSDETVEFSDYFIQTVINWYGIEKAKIMFAECCYFDDLHDKNYGYLMNGRPVIFDYAERYDYIIK